MPGLISHNYFSNAIIDSLDKGVAEIIDRHFDAYQVGAQGPDILFGLRVSAPCFRRFGNAVHEGKCLEVFDAAADYILDSGNEAALAFMLGMVEHYVLDKTIHPYVIYKSQGEMKQLYPPQYDNSSRHVVLETHLDNFVVNELSGGGYDTVLRGGSLMPLNKKTLEAIDGLFLEGIAPLYEVPLKKGMAARSTKRTKSFFALTNSGVGLGYFIMDIAQRVLYKNRALTGYFLEKANDKRLDAPNLNGKTWYSVLGGEKETTENFFEMLDRAKWQVNTYLRQFLNRVDSNTPMDKNIFQLNYNGEQIDRIEKNAQDNDGQGQHRQDL